MRKKKNKRTYSPGDGIRRRYYDSLEESRYRFPRKGLVHHPRAWFLSDAPLKRPLFGAYALGAFAEEMLWRSRHARGGRRPSERAAAEFFALTRRVMQNILSSYRIDRRLTAARARRARDTVRKVVDAARAMVEAMDREWESRLTPSTVI